jgi:zinc transport system permease protein
MAVGVLFVFLTPGYVPELNSFLFGNILTVSPTDIAVFATYTAVLIAFFAIYFKQIVACAFDPDFARVAGLPVTFITTAMTVFVALCIVLTIRLVGIMLLMSMLSLPMMIAEVWVHRFSRLMTMSVVISLICSVAGLCIGTIVDVPCSAIIVIIMTAAYILSRIFHAFCARMV